MIICDLVSVVNTFFKKMLTELALCDILHIERTVQHMNNRIREVRQHNSLSMKSFGDRLGISSAAVSKIETGVNTPSEQTIRAICSEFSINRDWLVDGIGEMQVQKPLLPEIIHNLRKYPRALEVLSAMRPEDWQAFEALLERLFEQKNKKETE